MYNHLMNLRTMMICKDVTPDRSVKNFYLISRLPQISNPIGIVHVAVRILYE